MYAVIQTGGKQYTVAEGDVVRVEKLPGEIGGSVEITDVLAVGSGEDIRIGRPTVDGARVIAEIIDQEKGKKVIVFKKKRRKGYSKKQGHRQLYTGLRIKGIKA